MKAWHIQNKDGELQEIVFADSRSEAIQKSEARGWDDYIDIRAKRAKYADDLEQSPDQLHEAQLLNGWWFECKSCYEVVRGEDDYIIHKGAVYCSVCKTESNPAIRGTSYVD